MAKIIYALSGEGRGHTSRVIAISDELRRRGHEIRFCCGGTAKPILEGRGEEVIVVPALRQVLSDNRVRILKTFFENAHNLMRIPQIVKALAETLSRQQPDLLITDFEAFSARAADLLGLPILSFNHQEVLTKTRYELPARYRSDAALARWAINRIVPRHPAHVLLTSFFFPPVDEPERTTLVAPIIRPDVQNLKPGRGEHVVVYYNQTDGTDYVLEELGKVDAQFVVYNFKATNGTSIPSNVTLKQPSLDGFLDDLAGCRAIVCTAGFTLISEALYLGKPLLVVPNSGIFEQTLNALFLERDQLGAALIDKPLTAPAVESFLERAESFEARLKGRKASGNDDALACIERLIGRYAGKPLPTPVTTI